MKKILFLIILCCSQTALAENISDSKKLLIDELLVHTGQSATDTAKLFSNLFIEEIIVTLKKAKPDIEPKAFEIIEQEVKQIIDEVFLNNKALSAMMYPIYGRRFSENELRELIAFYETPLGKKLIRVLPAITQEGMQAGQKLGQSMGPKMQQRILARLSAEGIEI